MDTIIFVEYHPKYAASIAEMWNKSGSSWGENFRETESTIITEYENKSYEKIWLAVDGEEVVGLCVLCNNSLEPETMILDLLNVRPDFLGKKLGRALVLKAVEEAVTRKKPRIDLFTWAGNTKAIPLYKKCGYFWEKRDDTVHLMNFIPFIAKTELLEDYFNKIDWYQDNVRDIEIKPDGRDENGFTFFTYHWKNSKTELTAEFCQKGRGLRKISCPDFDITVSVEKFKLVFGKKYAVKYEVTNITGKPLSIELQGKKDKNVNCLTSKKTTVTGHEVINGEFFPQKTE